jgi:small subunit ribosomal protein S4
MRYTGPKRKIERRENATIFGSEAWRKRPTLPGQHPVSRKRPSNYSIQFREKQKVKRTYLMTEKQFTKFFSEALKSTGNTGTKFLQLLEMRLDNVVYRMGFGITRNQARQFVNHGHIFVNGKRLDVPSYLVKINDEISISPKLAKKPVWKQIQQEVKLQKRPEINWLKTADSSGKVVAEPARDEIDKGIKEQFIVEFYSR